MKSVQRLVLLTNGIFGVDARTIHVALLDRLWSSKGNPSAFMKAGPAQMKGGYKFEFQFVLLFALLAMLGLTLHLLGRPFQIEQLLCR